MDCPWNHTPWFPHWVQFAVDSFPIEIGRGASEDTTFQPKYSKNVFKVTVGIDLLGRIVFWAGPHAGALNDGRLFSKNCPWKLMNRQAFGLADGAYGNRPRLVIPCRKALGSLTQAGTIYNAAHSFFRARIEQTFAFLWHFALVRNPWRGRENQCPFSSLKPSKFKVCVSFFAPTSTQKNT